jgi:hypothetical protein
LKLPNAQSKDRGEEEGAHLQHLAHLLGTVARHQTVCDLKGGEEDKDKSEEIKGLSWFLVNSVFLLTGSALFTSSLFSKATQ